MGKKLSLIDCLSAVEVNARRGDTDTVIAMLASIKQTIAECEHCDNDTCQIVQVHPSIRRDCQLTTECQHYSICAATHIGADYGDVHSAT